jgi:phosphoesterase RecJ-like protein
MLPPEAFDEAVSALDAAGEVALACHVNPDADAMGSMLGLGLHLRERGKRVVAASPNRIDDLPRWIEVLPGRDLLVPPGDFPKKPGLVVTLDAADPSRLEGLYPAVERAAISICVDHHRTNPGFGTINLVDPEAAATAVLVYRLLERLGGEIGPASAACLYAGIVTDTGRFQYEAASPDVLRIAAELRERPFDHTRLAEALYADSTLGYLRLLGAVLPRVGHVPEANLVWTSVTRKDLEEAEVPMSDTDELIDLIRTAREADVAAVIKEQMGGGYKVSMRSRGDTDVAQVAEAFGGGGHRLAAGYTSKAPSLERTRDDLVEALVQVNPVTAAP